MTRKQKGAEVIPIRPEKQGVEDIDRKRLVDDAEYRGIFRRRFLTDHFFAAKAIGFNDFIPHLHQAAVDLYFPKNPNIPIQDQHEIKFRMHIDPRKTFKTTLGKVDTAQWIAAFPEWVTILSEGATQPLAEAISISTAKFFYQRRGAAPTLVQQLFPEVVVTSPPEGKWCTPTHSDLEMDNTLDFTSPKTSQSGFHPLIINPDDMVDTTNSGIGVSHDTRQKVIEVYYTNENLLRKGGYINLRGTRYHPFELYGDLLAKIDRTKWKILIRSAMRVKSGARLMPGEFPPPEDVELLFPELLDYEELKAKFITSFEAFMCQLMNDPQGGNVATFTEKAYSAALCAPEHIPLMGETVICWRFPYGGKDCMAKYAEGAAARFYANRVYILDTWQGVYTPTGLAEKVVRELKHWQTGLLMLEAIPGTEYLDTHIRNESVRRNVSVRIQWLDFEDDDHLRTARIKELEPAFDCGRISISTALSKAAETRNQFLNFLLTPQNGIIDCIARLTARLPVAVLRKEIADEEAELIRRRQEDAFYNMIFGHAGYMAMDEQKRREQAAAAASIAAMNRTNELGLPDLFGLDG